MATHALRPWLLSALLASVLLPASGCASGQEEGGGEARGTTASASAKPVSEPLTAERLRQLALKTREVPQAYSVSVGAASAEKETRRFPPVSRRACQTVIDVGSGQGASDRITQIFNWKHDIFPGSTLIAAYKDGEAEKRFAALEKALAACHHYEGVGYAGRFEATLLVADPPQAGDEAVRFRKLVPMDPDEQPGDRDEQVTVVRARNVIIRFSMVDVGRSTPFPAGLINRQVERLEAAQGSGKR